MYTLFRFLPLMLSDLVPEGDSVWAFMLDYFNLVEMLLSPAFEEEDISILGVLIHNHLSLFAQTFTDSSMIFKQDHLVHYPRVIRSSGPLLYLSVLRYERKHQFFKKLANNICNFKNLTKSLAMRHQIAQFVDWRNGLPVKEDDFPGAKLVNFSEFFKCEDLDADEKFKNCNVLISKHAQIRGTRYNSNEAIIISISDDNVPVFGLIKHILVNNTHVYFFVVNLKIHFYDSHSRAYAVTQDSAHKFSFVAYSDVFDFHPLSLHSCFLESCQLSHICLRHRLVFNNYASLFDSVSCE